ncbi:MAG: alpha/beta fold hydrolase [Chloroflexota bacterium]
MTTNGPGLPNSLRATAADLLRTTAADPLRATSADLPREVVRAMDAATPDLSGARRRTVMSGGIPWALAEWGDAARPPVVLVHGVTSNAETFWRVAPALAAAGRHVVAVDLPGHGRTGHWQGRHRFGETATDLAAWIRTADLDRPGLVVLGHSWGGMVVAALPAAGLRPERLVLLDPPALPVTAMERMTHDPLERPYATLHEAVTAIRSSNPGWSDGDIEAKALGLTQFDVEAARAILLENGDWDGGLGALADPAARDVPVWLIRGEFAQGGLIPDEAVPAFAARFGADHVITIADAPHSPQRLYPEATILAILRALMS